MTTSVTPRLGSLVLYTMNEADAKAAIQKRRDAGFAARSGNEPREGDTYPAIIVRDNGMDPKEHARIRELIASGKYAEDTLEKRSILVEDEYRSDEGRARLIEQQLANHDASPQAASVNLQVLLDGDDRYWATSRSEFDPEKHGRWVQVSHGNDLELPSGLPTEADKLSEDIVFRPDAKGHWQSIASAAR